MKKGAKVWEVDRQLQSRQVQSCLAWFICATLCHGLFFIIIIRCSRIATAARDSGRCGEKDSLCTRFNISRAPSSDLQSSRATIYWGGGSFLLCYFWGGFVAYLFLRRVWEMPNGEDNCRVEQISLNRLCTVRQRWKAKGRGHKQALLFVCLVRGLMRLN